MLCGSDINDMIIIIIYKDKTPPETSLASNGWNRWSRYSCYYDSKVSSGNSIRTGFEDICTWKKVRGVSREDKLSLPTYTLESVKDIVCDFIMLVKLDNKHVHGCSEKKVCPREM